MNVVRPKWIAWICIGIFLVLVTASIIRRTPWWDEGCYADPAVSLVEKGRMGSTVAGEQQWGMLPTIHDYTYWIPPFYPAGLSIAFRVLGVSLFSMRAYSFFFSLLAVAAWFVVGRELTGRASIGWLASALLASDFAFIQLAGTGRPDAMVLGSGTAGLAAYLLLRNRSLPWAVLASWTLCGLAMFTHPTGFQFACDLLIITVWLDWRRLRPVHALWAALPVAVFAACWAGYIAQSPAAFEEQFIGHIRARTAARDTRLEATLLDIKHRYFVFYFTGLHGVERIKVVGLILYGAAFAAIAFNARLRSSTYARIAVAVAVVNYLLLANLDRGAFPHYMPMVLAPCALVAAIWIGDAMETRSRAAWVALSLFAASFAISVGGHGAKMIANSYDDEFRPLVERIRPLIADRGYIIAGSEFAFGFGFTPQVRDDVRLGTDKPEPPKAIVFNQFDLREQRFGPNALALGFRPTVRTKNFVLYER